MEEYVPDIYQESIYFINYEKLKDCGIKVLLFDLDNTLITSKEKNPSDKILELFESLKNKDFKIIIFSNASKKRVEEAKEVLNVDSVYRAKKPFRESFDKLLEKNKYNVNEVAIIGDQMMTDILGGNKVGITTILVSPMSSKEPFWLKISRFLENRKMKKLRDNDLFVKGRYYE